MWVNMFVLVVGVGEDSHVNMCLIWTGAVTSYTAERGELDGGRELLTKKKSASSGLKDTRWRIRKHNWPTKKREGKREREMVSKGHFKRKKTSVGYCEVTGQSWDRKQNRCTTKRTNTRFIHKDQKSCKQQFALKLAGTSTSLDPVEFHFAAYCLAIQRGFSHQTFWLVIAGMCKWKWITLKVAQIPVSHVSELARTLKG